MKPQEQDIENDYKNAQEVVRQMLGYLNEKFDFNSGDHIFRLLSHIKMEHQNERITNDFYNLCWFNGKVVLLYYKSITDGFSSVCELTDKFVNGVELISNKYRFVSFVALLATQWKMLKENADFEIINHIKEFKKEEEAISNFKI